MGRILGGMLVAALLLAASPAQASHTGQYGLNPVEHDDQGRGLEPDGRSTAVLGPMVGNRVVDLDGDGRAEPDVALPAPPPGRTQELNPGCWGDEGRAESGRCGLWTVGAGASATGYVVPPRTVPWPVSEDGRCQAPGPVSFPPGRLSGGCGDRLRPVRMLDAIHHACASALGVHYVEVNRKVDDAAARAASLGAGVPSPDAVAGPVCIWAWHGTWWDKNGNGVIDHHAWFHQPDAAGACERPCDGEPVAALFPHEEFTWLGACMQFGNPAVHNPRSVQSGYCALAGEGLGTQMVGWLYPGNHHSYLGAFPLDPVLCAACFYEPVDFPGHQVVDFAGAVANEVSLGTTAGPCDVVSCGGNRSALDESDAAFFGDPLLGPQEDVRADQTFNDRTGDPALTTRQWVYGLGWAAWMYDQSVLVRLVQVTGVGCEPGGPGLYRVASCRFADVDQIDAWSPEVEHLVQAVAKPAARGAWLLVRDNYDGAHGNVDAVANHRLIVQHPAAALQARTAQPGFSREPNDPGDIFPGAVFNARGCAEPGPANGFEDGGRRHRGWCNDYAAHSAGPQPWADMTDLYVVAEGHPLVCNGCMWVLTISGILLATTVDPFAPTGSVAPVLRADGDHRRTLMPGKYLFEGHAGLWHDQPQAWTEDVFLELPPAGIVQGPHLNPPDGWVGNLVASLGAWYYRGYADEDCGATDQPAWRDLDGDGLPEGHSWAECHPHRDGGVDEPHDYRGAEWQPQCTSLGRGRGQPSGWGPSTGVVTLVPEDGVWGPAPVLVWRDAFSGIRIRTTTTPPTIQGFTIVDLTGTTEPIEMVASCHRAYPPAELGTFQAWELLLLPLGNLDEPIRAEVAVHVGAAVVTDVDLYAPWGLGP